MLTVEPISDYSNEEFSSNVINFTVEQSNAPVNHLIWLDTSILMSKALFVHRNKSPDFIWKYRNLSCPLQVRLVSGNLYTILGNSHEMGLFREFGKPFALTLCPLIHLHEDDKIAPQFPWSDRRPMYAPYTAQHHHFTICQGRLCHGRHQSDR